MIKDNNRATKKGFTLIEILIYMGILSVLLVIFIDMFATLVNKQLEVESDSALQQDSNYLLSKISYDFGLAKNIVAPAAPGSPSATLRLLMGSEFDDYYLKDGNIISSRSGTLAQLNSSETTISNLTFQRLGIGDKSDVIQLKCTITSTVKKQSGYEVIQFATTLGIREK